MATQGLSKIEQQLATAGSMKEMLQMDVVQERFIANYQAVTGKKDGVNRFQSEVFAYMDVISEKPELAKLERFQHFKAIIRSATTGLSFRDNKLYVIPGSNNTIKIQSSPAGKREMLEMMTEIKQAPECVLVMKGDEFIVDKRTGVVKKHESTKDSVNEFKIENIVAAYQSIIWADGHINDVIVYNHELRKARAKTKTKADDSAWNTWTGEMCKKVATNRAFRLYHKYPDNVVTFGMDDDKHDDKTEEAEHTVVNQPVQEEQPAPVVVKNDAETDDFLKS